MKRVLAALTAVMLPLGLAVADGPLGRAAAPAYLDPAFSPVERAADLVARMTLSEKASQMVSSRAPAIPRLGVAAYGWWNEAAHGVAREQTNDGDNPPDLTDTTSYPVSLSLGSTWDPALVYREASQISDEAREVVRDNQYDLDFYSPTVNLARDPRWGRNDETFGEDPLLTASLAGQYVNGLQQWSGGYLKAIATVKHYAADNDETGRLTESADMDERTLREYYTAQFRDIIRMSHPGAIMSAYNAVNGVPAAADTHLIGTLARQTYGFTGYFTSDCDAIYEIENGHGWQPPGSNRPMDELTRTAYAQAAGEDLDCDMGYHDQFNYADTIPAAIAAGIRTPSGIYAENDVDVSLVRLFTARFELGEFDDETKVPWVAAARERLAPGTWVNSDANHAVTETPQRLALARTVADESIVLLKNQASALPLPTGRHLRVAVIGTYADPGDMYLGGYSSDQGPAGVANEVTAYEGLKKALPQAEVDFLPGTEPGDLDAVDPAAIKAAAGYDVAIVVAGTDAQDAAEAQDRIDLDLPGAQADLIRQVGAVNPHTIAYLETVGQVNLAPFASSVQAILWSSFNGQQQGAALADVVTGAADPGGRLPFTWYADENQLSATSDYTIRPTAFTMGRTYQYFTGAVSYPFGYGLTYTHFRYGGLHVTRDGSTLHVTATVTNTGPAAGAAVAQLYTTTPDAPASAQRPRKRLAGFQRVVVSPGQSAPVSMDVAVSDLAFFDEKSGTFVVDPQRYGFQLGGSSGDSEQTAYVRITDPPRPQPSVVTAAPALAGSAQQRVVFPVGARIDPHVTVALTDQSLHTTGVPVTYRSDHPSVVSDDLRTLAPGVATVTVTAPGASGSFVVVVR